MNLSKMSWLGLLSCLGGVLLLGFQALSTIMKIDGKWEKLALVDVVNAATLDQVEKISFFGVERGVDYVMNMPLFILLIAIGIVILIISGLFSK